MKKALKPFMKYVIRKTISTMDGSCYLLECGHEEWRNGKRRPTRLLCRRCMWKSEKEANPTIEAAHELGESTY